MHVMHTNKDDSMDDTTIKLAFTSPASLSRLIYTFCFQLSLLAAGVFNFTPPKHNAAQPRVHRYN